MGEHLGETRIRERMAAALQLEDPGQSVLTGTGTLESRYPVSDLATASISTVALAAAELSVALGFPRPEVSVDRALADAWYGPALHPVGWTLPSPWDAIAGDYPCTDGWIRLHTNAPHHRLAALRVLDVPGLRADVEAAVATWAADALETAIVGEGGCAAVLRSPTEWAAHPHGTAVAREPLVALEKTDREAGETGWRPEAQRPLAGLRVLDLTRVLAGPAATRVLASLGANVLRIDPPGWDEPALVPDMTLGKRAAFLDARDPQGLDRLTELLAGADVLVHGYRADALERLGLGETERRRLRPGLVDVSLNAYGHTGPWAGRRGFDSLVQMSSGIAWNDGERPTPLPVQALDYATGYLMAAAVLAGLGRRVLVGRGVRARLSLARTAVELATSPYPGEPPAGAPAFARSDLVTPWGPATLLPPPFTLEGVRIGFDTGPADLGSAPAAW